MVAAHHGDDAAEDRAFHQARDHVARLKEIGPFDRPIVTKILPLKTFYIAEDYHQYYYKKSPMRYNWYRSGYRSRLLGKVTVSPAR